MWFAAGLVLGLLIGHALTFLWIAWPRRPWGDAIILGTYEMGRNLDMG